MPSPGALEKKAENGELKGKFAQAVMENKSGSPLKQTKDGRDGSMFASFARGVDKVTRGLTKGFGHGNRHMNGPAPTPPNENSKAVLESEKKGDEAINDKMKAGPKKKNHKY